MAPRSGSGGPEGEAKDMLPRWLIPGTGAGVSQSLELTPLPPGCQTVSPLMIQSMFRIRDPNPRGQHVQVQEGQVLVGMAQPQQELQKNPPAETPECPESPELDPDLEEEEFEKEDKTDETQSQTDERQGQHRRVAATFGPSGSSLSAAADSDSAAVAETEKRSGSSKSLSRRRRRCLVEAADDDDDDDTARGLAGAGSMKRKTTD